MADVSLSKVSTRRDFEEAFQSAMSGADHALRTLWHFEKGQNLPKSYLIEFHPRHDSSNGHSGSPAELYSALRKSGRSYGASVRKTNDDSLLFLSHNETGNSAEFIIDCLNPRFLAFHTLSSAESTDRFIFERLTQYHPEFDLFWFPVALLEGVELRERVTGWEAQFDPLKDPGTIDEEDKEVESDEQNDRDNDDEIGPSTHDLARPRLNIRFELPDAMVTYRKLKGANLLPDVPLNSVLAERVNESDFTNARARIKSNGKITGRGADFDSYLQIVNGTIDNYADLITHLESEFWLKNCPSYDEEDKFSGFSISGRPFCIAFSEVITPIRLVRQIVNCKPPFRMMGYYRQIKDDYYTIDAIDLHVNQPLSIEITPNFMRIYLYEGTCGNTLVRILRSLQHHVDSNLLHPELVSASK